ncbi:diaminopimelate decarboxylase [Micavibrio aeruginosavorus]|uniref:Diaminopimelate decarboxylase n=1 Tax=Micavibrio aeruginosavorus EPB TaxID=349215 RepID=M4VJF3_9BACT|nr:diaminopimelate decarboxylase [Micavibrio aeruginosavorus]AGH98186.1 Diaminopimelate decarboxylase [Micavibrio aeruginosavorus EPB]
MFTTGPDGRLMADHVAVTDLVRDHGTPLYVYSASRMRDNVNALKDACASALPADRQPLIAFATKANSNLAVLNLFAQMGLGADVVSGGELHRAIRAGIDPAKIVFSGVGKNDDEIAAALDHGIFQINVESEPELNRIADIARHKNKRARVAFRLNPDVDAGTHEKITTGRDDNKFGLPAARVAALYQQAQSDMFLDPVGISLHIGSQLTSLEPYAEAFQKLSDFVYDLRNNGMDVRRTDLGGGLGIVYEDEDAPCLDSYAALIRDMILPLGTEIILEPGRLLVGKAGLLASRVLYVKETETRRYLVLDAGMNDLMRPALYDAFHAIRPAGKHREGAYMTYDVVGPVCETSDTFARARSLPPLQHDDVVAIMDTGAYGASMGSTYNTRPRAAEILVDGSNVAVIRTRETLESMLDAEQIPAWTAHKPDKTGT